LWASGRGSILIGRHGWLSVGPNGRFNWPGRKFDLPSKKARQQRASLYREKPAATPLNLEPQVLP
jgi:hypothetical protein